MTAQIAVRPTVPVDFNADQLEALKALLSLVHYDTLASEWRRMLPPALQPLGMDVLLSNLWEMDRASQ